MQRRRFLLLSMTTTAPAFAQRKRYPNRTVRLIAPQAPGGGVDYVARIVAEKLSQAFGENFVVDNQAGAGGTIATQVAARAAPDGYTLMVGYVATHATNPAVRKVPYDAVRDFTPVGMVAGTPNLLVVRPSLPVKTLGEFIAYARANPEKAHYGTSGIGTLNHLVMEQLKNVAGFTSLAVPYRSIAHAFTDLVGDRVQVIFPGMGAALPHVRNGSVRPIAVTGPLRHTLLPEVPTFKESGYDHFEGLTWYGIVGPAKMPANVTHVLNEEINRFLAQPDARDRLLNEALTPMPMSAPEFRAYIASEIAHWTRVARANHITGE